MIGGATCPEGWLCDNGEPRVVTYTDVVPASTALLVDASALVPSIPISSQSTGTGGTCYAPCGQAGDAADANDAGVELATCPPNASCRSTSVAGPDCLPGRQ